MKARIITVFLHRPGTRRHARPDGRRRGQVGLGHQTAKGAADEGKHPHHVLRRHRAGRLARPDRRGGTFGRLRSRAAGDQREAAASLFVLGLGRLRLVGSGTVVRCSRANAIASSSVIAVPSSTRGRKPRRQGRGEPERPPRRVRQVRGDGRPHGRPLRPACARSPQTRRRLRLSLAARTPSRRARAGRGARHEADARVELGRDGEARPRTSEIVSSPGRPARGRRASRLAPDVPEVAEDRIRLFEVRLRAANSPRRRAMTPGCRGRSRAQRRPRRRQSCTHSSHTRRHGRGRPGGRRCPRESPSRGRPPPRRPPRDRAQSLLRDHRRPIEVALLHCDKSQTAERSRPRRVPARLQRPLEPASPLAQMAAAHPKAREGSGEPQRACRVAPLQKVRED